MTQTVQQQQQQQVQQKATSMSISNQPQLTPNSYKKAGFFSSLSSSSSKLSQDDVKIQIYYSGVITVIYLRHDELKNENSTNYDFNTFCSKIRPICQLDETQPFTMKWVDEEGDPCSINSQIEFDEAIRLFYLNKESELVIHIFANVPQRPGTQCVGEDRSIYRRGARRWRKIYLVNGHKYQAKRFARTALCKVCQDRIWGLGRQGYKCLECKIMVHKRCHKFILSNCNHTFVQQQQEQEQMPTRNNLTASSTMSSISSSNIHKKQSLNDGNLSAKDLERFL